MTQQTLPAFIKCEHIDALVGPLSADCLVASVTDQEQCLQAISYARENGYSICPKGGGYSYGDAILNTDNLILDVSAMNQIGPVEMASGQVVVGPGASIIDIQKAALPHRLILQSVPSEPTITIAGAVAANVNGKDGWRAGNMGEQVVRLRLMTASGELIDADRSENADIFHGVIGGMGLLGVIVELTLQLKLIPSIHVHVARETEPDLRTLLSRLHALQEESSHAVAWLDCTATGKGFGRGVIHSAQWLDDSNDNGLDQSITGCLQRLDSRRVHASKLSAVVGYVVNLMMNFQDQSVGLFNKLYYHYCQLRSMIGTSGNDESIIRFSFDASFMIPSPAVVCGHHGYTIQLTVPEKEAEDAITELLYICQRSPCYPAKLILRIHRKDDFIMSFCEDGYSLNLEFHPKRRHAERMKRFADELIEITIKHGGKVHLAKDHILSQSQFQRLFPRFVELLAIKRRLDPEQLFQSDLYRRLLYQGDDRSSDERADATRKQTEVHEETA